MALDVGARNPAVRRISVVGATGSGKSFISRVLAKQLRLPHYELDTLRYDSGEELAAEKFKDVVEELASREEWIIDGHYRLVRHLIWNRADTIVWLDYPLPIVASRLLRRFAKAQKRRALARWQRSSLKPTSTTVRRAVAPATWTERLSRMARTIRERREYGRLLLKDQYPKASVVRLRSKSARDEWLERIGADL